MKRILAFIFMIIWLPLLIKAQDPMFSQFFLNSVDINPAVVQSRPNMVWLWVAIGGVMVAIGLLIVTIIAARRNR